MIRYFKQYKGSNRAVEIDKGKAVKLLSGHYTRAWRLLTDLPLEKKLKTRWTYFWKVKTK